MLYSGRLFQTSIAHNCGLLERVFGGDQGVEGKACVPNRACGNRVQPCSRGRGTAVTFGARRIHRWGWSPDRYYSSYM